MLYEALEEKTAAAAPPVSGRIKTLPPSQLIITSVARFGAARPREIGFAMDSPLEGDGFELLVPRHQKPWISGALRALRRIGGALKRYHLMVQPLFFCALNHSIEPGWGTV